MCPSAHFAFTATGCQFDRASGHCWQDGRLNTLYYKVHATGGVFAATSLPLWSLTCLDEEAMVQNWLATLHQFAGKAQVVNTAKAASELELTASHHALLCCAFEQKLDGIDALVNRVKGLNIFHFDEQTLFKSATELEDAGLLVAGQLQDKGLVWLNHSPYKIYADELKRMRG